MPSSLNNGTYYSRLIFSINTCIRFWSTKGEYIFCFNDQQNTKWILVRFNVHIRFVSISLDPLRLYVFDLLELKEKVTNICIINKQLYKQFIYLKVFQWHKNNIPGNIKGKW